MLTPQEKAKEVWCARFHHRVKGIIWILFDKDKELEGHMSETKNQLITRWYEKHGKFGTLTRFKGICRLSELIVTISHVRNPIVKA